MNNTAVKTRSHCHIDHVAQDVMSTHVVTARPEMMCEEVTELMLTNKISGLPVVDGNGLLIGVISLFDVANANFNWADTNTYFEHTAVDRLLAEEGFHLETVSTGYVSDYMSPEVYTATPDTPVEEVAELMANNHIHRVIILESDSQIPVGIVTTFDLLRLVSGHQVSSTFQEPACTATEIAWYMY